MEKYQGVIIEESLKDKNILNEVSIISTKVEKVTEKHKTPWLEKWTLHTVQINPADIDDFARKISKLVNDKPNSWYVDFNNGETFFVIYPNKVYKWKKGESEKIKECKAFGISLGIPPYQVAFPID